MSQDALTVNMGALNGSHQWGSASMGDAKHGVDVTIDLHNEPHGAKERAYIARSNCTPPGKNPWHPLKPVVSGKSKSHVGGIDIGKIKHGRYSIVVESPNSARPASCGNFQI